MCKLDSHTTLEEATHNLAGRISCRAAQHKQRSPKPKADYKTKSQKIPHFTLVLCLLPCIHQPLTSFAPPPPLRPRRRSRASIRRPLPAAAAVAAAAGVGAGAANLEPRGPALPREGSG
uniref:Uncharacterized protein n=1 Tax=Oryza punctata TaxID=4537 RepID=A0A0E0KA99_ORYPU